MGTPISPLAEQDRKRLDGIVDQMIANGESEDNIRFVVDDFKTKYAVKKKETSSVGLESASFGGGLGSSKSRGEVPTNNQPILDYLQRTKNPVQRRQMTGLEAKGVLKTMEGKEPLGVQRIEAITPTGKVEGELDLDKVEQVKKKNLQQKADKYEQLVTPLRNQQPVYTNPQDPALAPEVRDLFVDQNFKDNIYTDAVKWYAGQDSKFKRELESSGIDINNPLNARGKIPTSKTGRIMEEYLSNPDLGAFLESERPDLFPVYESISRNIFKDNPDYAKSSVANEVSREIQRSGYNAIEPVFNYWGENAKEYADLVAKNLFHDDPEKMKIWDEEIKNNQEKYLDAPSFFEGVGSAGKEFFSGLKKTATQPFASVPETIRENWDKEASSVSANPKGLVKTMRDIGHGTGVVMTLASPTGLLKAAGMTPKAASALSVGTAFFGDQLEQAQLKYPNNPVKAWTSAGINTTLYSALAYDLFPADKAMKAFERVKPQLDKVSASLANGAITREVARQEANNIFKDAVLFGKEALKTNTKVASEMAGLTALNKGLDRIMMDEDQFNETYQGGEEADTFKHLFLSNSLVAALSGVGKVRERNKVFEEAVYEAASNPIRYRNEIETLGVRDPQINSKEILDNLDYIADVRKQLDTQNLSESARKRYIAEALKSKVARDAKTPNPEESLSRKHDEAIRKSDDVKNQILEGKEPEDIDHDPLLKEIKGNERVSEIEQNEGIQYFRDKAAEDPAAFMDIHGKKITKQLLEQVPTDKLVENRDYLVNNFGESESTDFLSQIIKQREPADEVKIDQDRVLEGGDLSKETAIESKPSDFISDMESKGFYLDNGQYQRNGVAISIKRGATLVVNNSGDVIYTDSPNQNDIVLKEIKIINESARGKGEATKALDDFLESADKHGYTTYIEPAPIKRYENKSNLTQEQLVNWYEKRGFEKKNNSIWVRIPKTKEQNINETTTKETTEGTQPVPTEQTTETKAAVIEDSGAAIPPTEGERLRLTHADTERIYQESGLPLRLDTPTKHRPQLIAEAEEKLRNGYDYNKVAEETMKGDYNFEDTDQYLFARKVADLKSKQKGLDIKSKEFDNIQNEIEKLSRASDVAGTLVARSLEARKYYVPVEESLSDYVMQEKEVNKNAPLTDTQKETIQKEYEDIQTARKNFDDYMAQKEAEFAQKEAAAAFEKQRKATKKSERKDYAAERKQIFENIREKLKKARGETSATILPYAKELAAIAPDVLKLVKNLAEEGVVKIADAVREIHAQLKPEIPEITEKDVNDIIAGVWTEKKPTKNELAERVYSLRQQAKLVNKLESLLKGEIPTNEKRKVKYNQEIQTLKDQISNIKSFDSDLAKQKEAALDLASAKQNEISKAINKEQKKQDKEDRKEAIKTLEADEKSIKSEIKAEELEAKKIEKELMYRTEEEKRLDGYKANLIRNIQKIEGQISKGDYSKPEPPKKIILDKEGLKLKDKLIKLKQQREARIVLQQRQNETFRKKGGRLFTEALNIPRTLMTIGDFSALLRQNIFFSAGHPLMSGSASKEMFKAAFSQKYYDRWFDDLKNSDDYQLIKDSKLSIADSLNHDLSKREEAFMSSLAEKRPIFGNAKIKLGGKKIPIGLDIVKGSERSYTMLLNKMRVDVFRNLVSKMQERGVTFDNNPRAYTALAEYINNATGRSDFGERLNRIAPILNGIFFSPRLMASRVNMLTYFMQPRFWNALPVEARVDYMRNWISLLAIGGTILGLAKLGGAEVEDDPRSSDFGKIKSGKTRWDIWGGAQPYIRSIAQIGTGQRKSTTSGAMYDLDGNDIFGETRMGVATDFFRNKLAPVPGAAVDLLSGRTSTGDRIVYDWGGAEGKEISIDQYVKQRLLPMTITSTAEAMKDQGIQSLFTVGIPNTFGVGTQTYGKPEKLVKDHVNYKDRKIELTKEQRDYYQEQYNKKEKEYLDKVKGTQEYKNADANKRVDLEKIATRKAAADSEDEVIEKYKNQFKPETREEKQEREKEERINKKVKEALR